MLERLHPDIRVTSAQRPARKKEVASLQRKFPKLPQLLCEMMLEATDVHFSYRGKYFCLYGPESLDDMNDAHEVQKWIPNGICIGNDGGQAIILLDHKIFRCGWGCLDIDQLKYVADSIEDLLILAKPAAKDVGDMIAEQDRPDIRFT